MAPASSCKLAQVIAAGSSAGVDVGATSPEEAAALFTKQAGFKVGEPNVIVNEIPGECFALGMTISNA